MDSDTRRARSTGGGWKRTAARGAGVLVVLATLGACAHLAMMFGNLPERPAESEFGFGPRASAAGIYRATLEPAEPLGTRRMHAATLVVQAPDEAAVEGASISVDGGMPQHGHGLPTAPRVTRSLGGGAYRVEGLRFNMGGWWELKFRIASEAGTDSVTFNLAL